jgi:hypothetical protein
MTIKALATIRNSALAAVSPKSTTPPPVAIGVATAYAAAGPLIAGTSNTTNVVDAVLAKSFVINEYNRSFYPGTRLRATAVGASNVWMEGIVGTWDGQTVAFTSVLASGGGTYANWQINVAGQPGVQGPIGPQGPQGGAGGAQGPAGPPGAPGSVWRNGNGVPANSLGVDGDYYLDDASGNVYLRSAAAGHTYTVVSNIEGPQGAQGTAGPSGGVWRDGTGVPANTLGVDGDYYLDHATGNVYVRASGSYSVACNIKGPIGNTGPVGPQGAGYVATSTSSLALGLGSHVFATQAGLAYAPGVRARASSNGTPTAWMEGQVTAYSGTSLTVNVDLINGSGTYADWNINLTGQIGAQGPQGPGGTGSGNVSNVGTPASGQIASWTGPTTIQGSTPVTLGLATVASPTFTGNPLAPTAATVDNSTSIATTAFVKAQGYITASALVTYAPLATPVFTGNPQGPTPATGDNSTSLATTAFVKAQGYAPLATPVFTGNPTAPTPAVADNTQSIATTAFVKGQNYLSPSATNNITVGYTFTANNLGNIGTPLTPNPALGNYQYGNNNAAFTLNAPTSDCAMDVLITNTATAGAVTFSGYTVGTTGDPLDTTSGHKFIISIRRIGGTSTYAIKALQ